MKNNNTPGIVIGTGGLGDKIVINKEEIEKILKKRELDFIEFMSDDEEDFCDESEDGE